MRMPSQAMKPRPHRANAPPAPTLCSQPPSFHGRIVGSGHNKSGAIALSKDVRSERAAWVASACVQVDRAGDEVVVLRAIVADTARRDDHGQQLADLERRTSHAEGEDVFVSLNRVVVWQSLDVFRIVKESVSLGFNETAVVLSKALKTPTPRGGDVRLPVRCSHQVPSSHFYEDPAVDDRDQVRVGDEVEDMARPRSIDAREQSIAVECGEEAVGLNDGELERFDLRFTGGRA